MNGTSCSESLGQALSQSVKGRELAALLSEGHPPDFLLGVWCLTADWLLPRGCSLGDWLIVSRQLLPEWRSCWEPWLRRAGWPWPERTWPEADWHWPAWPVSVLDERWVVWPSAETAAAYDIKHHRRCAVRADFPPIFVRTLNLGGLVWKFRRSTEASPLCPS